WARNSFWLDVETYIRRNNFFGRGPALGYLKPVFRAAYLKATNVTYDERLPVAEDYDFVFRLLQCGAKFLVDPQLTYFYRRHSASVSHRLTADALRAIKLVELEAQARCPRSDRKLAAAMDARVRSIETAVAFDQLVDAIKRRDLAAIARVALARP